MTADEEQLAVDSRPADGGEDDTGLAAFRERARALLEAQRAKIRLVEATLTEQVASLFEATNREKRSLLDQQREISLGREQLAREQDEARLAQQQAEQLLNEARDGLTIAMRQQSELRAQLAESNELLAARTAELERLQGQTTAGDPDEILTLNESVAQLTRERDALQQQLANPADGEPSADSGNEELCARFESAVQEIRALKAQNEDLVAENHRLAEQRNASRDPADSPAAAEGFDWEAQKQALMQQMESDFDVSDEQQKKKKLTVEGAIRITDQVVADKDREIQELQKLLENQSSNIGDVAVGAAAVAEMLDHDDLIREERENLKQLQEEWREKLRQAEVEISVERAKFARERAQLEEQVRAFEGQQAAQQASGGDHPEDKKGHRGNWLSRLGLKEDS